MSIFDDYEERINRRNEILEEIARLEFILLHDYTLTQLDLDKIEEQITNLESRMYWLPGDED